MADLFNLAQAAGVASLTVGVAGLTFSQFASGVMGLAGTLRASNLVNAINGFQVNGTSLASTHLSDSSGLARLASPAFTGTPTSVTPAADDNTTKLATTAYVIGQFSSSTPLMNGTGAAGTSTRMARSDHVHPTDTSRAPLASPGLTGTPTAPTPVAGDSSTKIATTAFVTAAAVPSGTVLDYAGISIPSGYLACDGSAVARATYPNLFASLVASKGAATVTIASPGVWTLSSHGFNNGDVIYIETTGALPTGLSADTAYYVVAAATNTFQLSATKGGAAINTSGSQSGTHTVFQAPHARATMSSTTFNVPDTRGRAKVNKNAGTFINLGATGGEETHQITLAEMASHNHGGASGATSAGTPTGTLTIAGSGTLTTGTESADHTHSGLTQPNNSNHSHSYHAPVTGNVTQGGIDGGIVGYTTANTDLQNTNHAHSFTTGGRSTAHTHSIVSHGHAGSTFAGDVMATHTHTISSNGSDTAHNNLQPYYVIQHIIKV